MPQTRNQANAAAQAKSSGATEASETSTSKDGGDQAVATLESEPPRRDSPDNCSICLGPFVNKSFPNNCAHSFCFQCLKQWSMIKAECPLCKQRFTRIIHNIISSQLYETYELPRPAPTHVNQYIHDYVGGLRAFTGPSYLDYIPQPFDADLTLSNFSRFQFRHRRYDRLLNPVNIHGEHPYSFTHSAVTPSIFVSATSWPRGAEDFRREVYRRNIGPPAVILGNENSTYRLTPALILASSHRIHRIMPWLTRELHVLLRNQPSVTLTAGIIQTLLQQVTIDSVFFHDRVRALLGRRTQNFIEEFLAFANSALSMQAFDSKAMYLRHSEHPPSSHSSTSSENDVVEITGVSQDPVLPRSVTETHGSSSQPLDLRRSGWDSPTPGPSWVDMVFNRETGASVDQVSVSSESDDPVYIPDQRDPTSDNSRDGSDIVFVKYDKPWEERSPINLASDSEKEEAEVVKKKKKKSKHKKHRKMTTEKDDAEKKGKKKKHSRDKSQKRERSKSSFAEAAESQSESVRKRHHSSSSSEPRMKKRHKKSKDKGDRSETNRDRQIVDRLFAEAFVQQQKKSSGADGRRGDSPKNSKGKEKSELLSTKEKSKKKKKRKNRSSSRDSRGASYSHSFKKHHSGHKKSSAATRMSLSSSRDRSRFHHSHSHPEGENESMAVSRSSRRDSFDTERDPTNQQRPSNSTISHSVTSGFQPSYLPLPDTVQHIPVNLWVSTWPAMPMSHSYHSTHSHPSQSVNPTASTSSSSTTVISTSSNTPFMPKASSVNSTPRPSTNTQDSSTYTRDSSSSDSSTDESGVSDDEVDDRKKPPQKNVDSRTMHWLETHCPSQGNRQQLHSSLAAETQPAPIPSKTAVSSSSSSASSTSSKSACSHIGIPPLLGTNATNLEMDMTLPDENKADDQVNVEIVSIGSGDEDIVVCSSASQSDSDEIHCLDEDPNDRSDCMVTSLPPPLSSRMSTSTINLDTGIAFPAGPSKSLAAHESSEKSLPTLTIGGEFGYNRFANSSSSNVIVPSSSQPFQPFKLNKKSPMNQAGYDPFFGSMSPSSDEDQVNDNGKSVHTQVSTTNSVNSFRQEESATSFLKSLGVMDHFPNNGSTSSANIETGAQQTLDVKLSEAQAPKMSLESRVDLLKATVKATSSSLNGLSSAISTTHYTTPFNASTSTHSPLLSAWSPSPHFTSVSSTVLPSGISYLPYSTLPTPSSTSTSFPPVVSTVGRDPNLILSFLSYQHQDPFLPPITSPSASQDLMSSYYSMKHQVFPSSSSFTSSNHAVPSSSGAPAIPPSQDSLSTTLISKSAYSFPSSSYLSSDTRLPGLAANSFEANSSNSVDDPASSSDAVMNKSNHSIGNDISEQPKCNNENTTHPMKFNHDHSLLYDDIYSTIAHQTVHATSSFKNEDKSNIKLATNSTDILTRNTSELPSFSVSSNYADSVPQEPPSAFSSYSYDYLDPEANVHFDSKRDESDIAMHVAANEKGDSNACGFQTFTDSLESNVREIGSLTSKSCDNNDNLSNLPLSATSPTLDQDEHESENMNSMDVSVD